MSDFLIKFLFFYALTGLSRSASKLRCPIKWNTYSSGNSLPEDIFQSKNNEYFGRSIAEDESNENQFGIVNSIDLKLYIPFSEKIEEFEILTNPNECELEWVPSDSLDTYKDMMITYNGKYLGKAVQYNGDFRFGIVDINSNSIIYFEDSFEEELESGFYDILACYSDGVVLSITGFVFDKSPESKLTLVGMDEIFNVAETTITQTITQTTIVQESIRIAEFSESSFSIAGNVKGNIGFQGFGANYKFEGKVTETESSKTEYSKTMSRAISTSRDVFVLPNTSVIVCSLASSLENFVSDYWAINSFSVKGWNGQEVKQFLISQNDEFADLEVLGDTAFKRVHGTFEGSLTMNSKFVIIPANSIKMCLEF